VSKLHQIEENAVEAAHARGALYPITSTVATNSVEDDDFYIVDGTDNTKRVAFSLGNLTTATDRTITLPDRDIDLGLVTVVDTGGAFATPIVLTAADSGKVYLLDDAAGLDFTLPAISASNVGMHFRFVIQTTNTSNSYRFTAQAADLLIGGVWMVDTDAAYNSATRDALFAKPDGSDDLIMDLTSDATGGMIGGDFEFLAITATRWWVSGTLAADGVVTNPFA
jgi:hypothetical protein